MGSALQRFHLVLPFPKKILTIDIMVFGWVLLFPLLAGLPLLSSCRTVEAPPTERMTVAMVQRELHKGMSKQEVVEVLGAPNMITHGEEDRETWVYERISSHSQGTNSAFSFIVGGKSRAESVESSRSLTVIIHFDTTEHVSKFSYRNTTF
jgi:outer membrane protein assembly factor BamE (lipoprotein component of BamABCDE complex)